MKITIELVPGGLISVHYDDGITPKAAVDALMTATVNVFVGCLRTDMTHREIGDLCHMFGKVMESTALALYKLERDGMPGGFSQKAV